MERKNEVCGWSGGFFGAAGFGSSVGRGHRNEPQTNDVGFYLWLHGHGCSGATKEVQTATCFDVD